MGLFTSNKKTKYIEPESYPGAKANRGLLAGVAQPGAEERLRLAGTEYQGPLVAALSEFEQQGLAELGDYLNSPLGTEGELYGSAEEEILKTLQGEYDPVNSDYYKAYKNQIMREIQEAKDRLAARASAGDKFFGGGRISTEGEMEESALGQMAVTLGELQERERERRLGAVQQALQLTQYGEEAPVARITAAETLGALPRLIKQAEYDADYQEWMRALNDLGIALDTATGLATYQPNIIAETSGGGSDVATIMRLAGPIAGAISGA